MQSEGAGAFWSYVHADDDAEGGRIVDLAHDLQAQYALLSGGQLDLFLDRDAIGWGDDWRERIAEALSAATFFIPIMTPGYFNSQECRRELISWVREATRLGVQSLLLPVLYVRIVDLELHDQTDEAMALVKPLQHEPWTDLRLEDRHSQPYRTAVARLAQALIDRVLTVSQLSQPTPHESVATDDDDDEAPGALDLLVDAEAALPRWQAVVDGLGPTLDRLSEIAQAAAAQMQRSDARGGGAAGRLVAATAAASRMREPADEILRLGEQNTREVEVINAAITALLDELEAQPPREPDERAGALGLFDSVEQLAAAAAVTTENLKDLFNTLDGTARAARTLRPIARDLQKGVRGFVDAQATYDEWVRRIHQIRPRLEKGADRDTASDQTEPEK